MPNRDGTGPNGLGSGTGRRMGYCEGNSNPDYLNFYPRGRGFRRRCIMPMQQSVELTQEQKKKILEAELKNLESEKKEIEKELKNIKS